jgi:hypothetical protein
VRARRASRICWDKVVASVVRAFALLKSAEGKMSEYTA